MQTIVFAWIPLRVPNCSFIHLLIKLLLMFYYNFTENEFPLLAGHLKLIRTLFTCEGVDKKGLGKWNQIVDRKVPKTSDVVIFPQQSFQVSLFSGRTYIQGWWKLMEHGFFNLKIQLWKILDLHVRANQKQYHIISSLNITIIINP